MHTGAGEFWPLIEPVNRKTDETEEMGQVIRWPAAQRRHQAAPLLCYCVPLRMAFRFSGNND
jgi:hypothetical protein